MRPAAAVADFSPAIVGLSILLEYFDGRLTVLFSSTTQFIEDQIRMTIQINCMRVMCTVGPETGSG